MRVLALGTWINLWSFMMCIGQIQGSRMDTNPPSFDINFLKIKGNNQDATVHSFTNTDLEDFLSEFPNPDKNENFYFEMDEKMARILNYKTNEFYFLDEKLDAFIINDPSFSIGNGKEYIKVGDPISKIEKAFFPFEKEIRIDRYGEKPYGVIRITFSNNDLVFDDGMVILVNPETNRITKIQK